MITNDDIQMLVNVSVRLLKNVEVGTLAFP